MCVCACVCVCVSVRYTYTNSSSYNVDNVDNVDDVDNVDNVDNVDKAHNPHIAPNPHTAADSPRPSGSMSYTNFSPASPAAGLPNFFSPEPTSPRQVPTPTSTHIVTPIPLGKSEGGGGGGGGGGVTPISLGKSTMLSRSLSPGYFSPTSSVAGLKSPGFAPVLSPCAPVQEEGAGGGRGRGEGGGGGRRRGGERSPVEEEKCPGLSPGHFSPTRSAAGLRGSFTPPLSSPFLSPSLPSSPPSSSHPPPSLADIDGAEQRPRPPGSVDSAAAGLNPKPLNLNAQA